MVDKFWKPWVKYVKYFRYVSQQMDDGNFKENGQRLT